MTRRQKTLDNCALEAVKAELAASSASEIASAAELRGDNEVTVTISSYRLTAEQVAQTCMGDLVTWLRRRGFYRESSDEG